MSEEIIIMISRELSDEQKKEVTDQKLIIGKWFKEQRIKNWEKLGFKEPMSPHAMGLFFGFAKSTASKRIFDLESGKHIPPRARLEIMCIQLGYPPAACYHRGPYERYLAKELEHAQALDEAAKRHERGKAAYDRHMRQMGYTNEGEVKTEIEATEEYA
jgi:hypothetical protein